MNKYKIALILESVAPIRCWDKNLEFRNELLKRRNDIQLYEISQHKPKNYIEDDRVIQVFDKTLRELLSILYWMDLVVSVDTGPMHASLALNIPTICLFTHIPGKIRCNCYEPEITHIIQGECVQSKQCWYDTTNCLGIQHNKAKIAPCIESITVDQVVNKVNKVLSKPNLSYCIVYANDKNIGKCLALIREYKKTNEEVVVVNNGCQTYKENEIKALFNNYQYIENEENLGCIIARNQAIKAARGTYVFTLDDDQFISIDTIHKLQSINADIVGSEAWSMDENYMAHRIN